MIKSMTGYGIAHFDNDAVSISVEVKTLNSKFLDLSIRSPKQFADKELEIRNLVTDKLERGKVNLTIEYQPKGGVELPISINEALFTSFYEKYRALVKQVGAKEDDIFKLALQSPNVSTSNVDSNKGQEDWEAIKQVIVEAIDNCDRFRQDEGNTLYQRFEDNIRVLEEGLEQVKLEEPRRREKLNGDINSNLSEWLEEHSRDQNRLDQELIYYFEKLDITEEIERLGKHLAYLKERLS